MLQKWIISNSSAANYRSYRWVQTHIEYVWLYCSFRDDVRSLSTKSFRICSIGGGSSGKLWCVLARINKSTGSSTHSFGTTQCNLMNVIETTRHHFVQSTVKNYAFHGMLNAAGFRVLCTTRSPSCHRCYGYIWTLWNYFTTLWRSPRRRPL